MRIRYVGLWIVGFAFSLAAGPLSARVLFDGLDLAEDDRLLFTAKAGGDGSSVQNALFVANVSTLSVRQLTAFPEQVDILESGRTVQIRNAFGSARIPISGGLPRSIAGFPSFADGAPVLGGRVEAMAPSKDGKWILYVEPVTAAYGNLVLINSANGSRTLITRDVERPGRTFPALWSPDSRVFVYHRDGKLYYHSVTASTSSSVDERYRAIGDGSISSVYWGLSGDFFYLRGSTVYRVRSSELFARALYADFLEIGQVAGKIPFDFDPNFDIFWVAPDSRAMLLSKGGRNLFYYPLGNDDYGAGFESSLPYLMLPRSSSNLNVLWSSSGLITVIASIPSGTKRSILTYRLDISKDKGPHVFYPLEAPKGTGATLSPDGTRAVVWGDEGTRLYDYINWKVLSVPVERKTLSAHWLGNEEYLVADVSLIQRVSLSGNRVLLCLSASESHAFEESGPRIVAKVENLWYATEGTAPWKETPAPAPRATAIASTRYRVYLEKQSGGPYDNLPMVRNIRGVGTISLVIKNNVSYDPLPAPTETMGEANLDGVFRHGRRSGRRELSLSFDLMDDAEGLPQVLETLRQFGVRATFFLNGEFIRRHPSASKEIAEAGHETASMFYAPIDLSDARYRIDDDFIQRGLARNEDEFFQATGSEIALLWHPPYYAVSSKMVTAAAAVGYKTLGLDVDPMDWVSRTDIRRISLPYRSASQIVDDIMAAKRPGSIIPIRIGIPSGGRDDYLFGRLDVLLDALVRTGYSAVPISTLMENAR